MAAVVQKSMGDLFASLKDNVKAPQNSATVPVVLSDSGKLKKKVDDLQEALDICKNDVGLADQVPDIEAEIKEAKANYVNYLRRKQG